MYKCHCYLVVRSVHPFHKGQEIRATTSFNLSRNIVALQAEKSCRPYQYLRAQLVAQQNLVLQVTEKHLLEKAELGFTLRNMLPQLATLTFVA